MGDSLADKKISKIEQNSNNESQKRSICDSEQNGLDRNGSVKRRTQWQSGHKNFTITKTNYLELQDNSYVGGRLPDSWCDYCPYKGYFTVPRLRIKGILPCKTFLAESFERRLESSDNEFTSYSSTMWSPSLVIRKKDTPSTLECDDVSQTLFQSPRNVADHSKNLEPDEQIDMSDVACVINLCLTERYYSSDQFKLKGIEYFWFSADGGGSVPPLKFLYGFLELFAVLVARFPNKLIVLHCTHGVNRTGFLSALLLMAFSGMHFQKALQVFERSRGHPVNRENLIHELSYLQSTLMEDSDFINFINSMRVTLCEREVIDNEERQSGAILKLSGLPINFSPSKLHMLLLRVHYNEKYYTDKCAVDQKPLVPLFLIEVKAFNIKDGATLKEEDVLNQVATLHFASSDAADAFVESWPTLAELLNFNIDNMNLSKFETN